MFRVFLFILRRAYLIWLFISAWESLFFFIHLSRRSSLLLIMLRIWSILELMICSLYLRLIKDIFTLYLLYLKIKKIDFYKRRKKFSFFYRRLLFWRQKEYSRNFNPVWFFNFDCMPSFMKTIFQNSWFPPKWPTDPSCVMLPVMLKPSYLILIYCKHDGMTGMTGQLETFVKTWKNEKSTVSFFFFTPF